MSDAATMLAERDEKIYIIGGLVDHNQYTNLTLDKANLMKIPTAKLPIDEYDIKMKTSKVLSINQVFEIVLEICTGSEWKETLIRKYGENLILNYV